jgi:hypothetical protein
MMKPADAARAPAGPTKTMTGVRAAIIRDTIVRVESSRPPGVRKTNTVTAAPEVSARAMTSSKNSAAIGWMIPSYSATIATGASAPCDAGRAPSPAMMYERNAAPTTRPIEHSTAARASDLACRECRGRQAWRAYPCAPPISASIRSSRSSAGSQQSRGRCSMTIPGRVVNRVDFSVAIAPCHYFDPSPCGTLGEEVPCRLDMSMGSGDNVQDALA